MIDFNFIINEIKDGARHVSFSSLKNLEESPRAFKRYYTHDRVETKDMLIGSVFHSLCLENDKFEQIYAVEPKINGRTKEGKSEKEAFKNDNKGKRVISYDIFEAGKQHHEAVMNCKKASAILNEESIKEKEFFFSYKGFKIKFIPDLITDTLYDLKKCPDANPRKFEKVVFDRHIEAQMALYILGLKENGIDVKKAILIASDGQDCSLNELSREALKYGESLIDKWLDELTILVNYPHYFNEGLDYNYGTYLVNLPKYLTY